MIAACTKEYFLLNNLFFMMIVFSIGLTLNLVLLSDRQSPVYEGFPLLLKDLSKNDFILDEFIVFIGLTVFIFHLLGMIFLPQFCMAWCLRIPNRFPGFEIHLSRCAYCILMFFILPATAVFVICLLGECWNVTLFHNYEVDFDVSKSDPVWNKIQYTFECCGQYNHTDWGSRIPRSCCKDTSDTCNETTAYKKGCHPFIKEIFADALRSKTIPLQFFYLTSLGCILLLFCYMLNFVFHKCFNCQPEYQNGRPREDDVEAVSLEAHVENDDESDDQLLEDLAQNVDEDHNARPRENDDNEAVSVEDHDDKQGDEDESDEQLLEDFVQNVDDDHDTELLLDNLE